MRWVHQALEKNIDLGFEDIPRLAPLRGDTASLAEMLNNLIDNAIRYTPAGGRHGRGGLRAWWGGITG